MYKSIVLRVAIASNKSVNNIKFNRSKGMAALMLVLWTSLALAGLLFDMASEYGLRLGAIKIEQHRQRARMASLLCRDMLSVEFSENARFVPVVGTGSTAAYKNISCRETSFNSSAIVGLPGGETKTFQIEGKDSSSTAMFTIETKINISNDAGAIPTVIYTKEISERS